jgi:hypothetical protein
MEEHFQTGATPAGSLVDTARWQPAAAGRPEISLVTPSRQEIPLILHRLQREKIQTQIRAHSEALSNPD